MSGLKGGALLMVLAIPFGLYAAWQANGVVRTDMVVSEPPADRGAPKEQLTAARAKANAWTAETRKAVAVAWQYRPVSPDDATPGNAEASSVVAASAARSADLTDLDLFLTGVESPKFAGTLKDAYKGWAREEQEAGKSKQAVEDWLRKPLTVTSAADAVKAMAAADERIKKYTAGKFTDRAKAAQWQLQARMRIIEALATQADAQYRAAVKVKLPLEPGNNAVKLTVETLRGLEEQIAALNTDVKLAKEDGIKLDPAVLAAVEAKTAVAVQCAASKELFTLFAKDDLFRNPDGAATWLKQVTAQYNRTQDEAVKTLLREKVQEFCEAFIPVAVRLDDKILIRDKPVLRAVVTVKYDEGGETKRAPLSDEMDGLNEFNLLKRHPGKSTLFTYDKIDEYPKDVTPTELSLAAVTFNTERAKIAGITGPKWTVKSVAELKKTCDAQSELVNRLKAPGTGIAGDELKIGKRLESLVDGLKSAADLIERAP